MQRKPWLRVNSINVQMPLVRKGGGARWFRSSDGSKKNAALFAVGCHQPVLGVRGRSSAGLGEPLDAAPARLARALMVAKTGDPVRRGSTKCPARRTALCSPALRVSCWRLECRNGQCNLTFPPYGRCGRRRIVPVSEAVCLREAGYASELRE